MTLNFIRRWWLGFTLIRELSKFLASGRGNVWIYLRYAKLYVRCAPVYIEDRKLWAITLASVTVYDEYQNRGFFEVILKVIEDTVDIRKYDVVVVENIHNPKLHDRLVKHGYKPIEHLPETLYKRSGT